MHSRIFQLEKHVDNAIESPLHESDLYEGFLDTVADYVYDDTNRFDDYEWLKESLADCSDFVNFDIFEDDGLKIHHSITFKNGFKSAYFEKRFHKFKELANSMDLEKFIDPFEVYVLNKTTNDKAGFYVYGLNCGWMSFDEFVRYLPNGGDTTYYCGNTVGYHL